jgi:hypothetical protein
MNVKLAIALLSLAAAEASEAQQLRLTPPTVHGSIVSLDNAGSTPWMIEGSDDLSVWSPLWRVKTPLVSVNVTDEKAAGKTRRFFRARNATGDTGQSTQDLRAFWSHGTAANTMGSIRFTHLPMNLADFQYLVPIGAMVGNHVTPIDHLYFSPVNQTDFFDVFAPADGHIVLIQKRVVNGQTPQYRIVFEHTGAFWSYYDLVSSLDSSVLTALGVPDVPDNTPQYVRVAVTSGQRIGNVGTRTLDWGVVYSELTRGGFSVPNHYDYEPWKIHTVDPLDYYDDPLRSQLLAKCVRVAPPFGGKIDFDKDGTAAGNWFLKGTGGYAGTNSSQYWTGHLALSYYHVDPSVVMFSIGDWQGSQRQYWVKNNTPDPATVTEASGVVKWELLYATRGIYGQTFQGIPTNVQGILLFQVLPNRELKAEIFPGLIGTQVSGFTAAARIYER